MTKEELLEQVEQVFAGNEAQAYHDMETIVKVRTGKICKAMNSAYVIWSREYYEREMERIGALLGAVPGAGHSERDPAGVQRERTEPDGP